MTEAGMLYLAEYATRLNLDSSKAQDRMLQDRIAGQDRILQPMHSSKGGCCPRAVIRLGLEAAGIQAEAAKCASVRTGLRTMPCYCLCSTTAVGIQAEAAGGTWMQEACMDGPNRILQAAYGYSSQRSAGRTARARPGLEPAPLPSQAC